MRVTIFNQEIYDGEWPPQNAIACLKWFTDKINSIPEEYIDNAEIEFDSVSGYEGEHYAHISISYTRPETDEEKLKREESTKAMAERTKANELRQLAELKLKYGQSEDICT